MRKLFLGLVIVFGLLIGGFFILDNFVLNGFFTVMAPALISPGDATANEMGIDKMWGQKQFLGSITGPREPYTEKLIIQGMETKNPTICESLKNSNFEYNRCNAELALLLTDKSLCKNLANTLPIFNPETCVATIDAILNEDSSECSKAPERGQNICLQDVARILEDPTICESLSKSDYRCYWNLAVGLERDDLCEISPYTQACTSIANRDGSMCGLIIEEIERTKCFYNTAILTNDVAMCKNIDDGLSSSTCTSHIDFCSKNNYDCTFLSQRYT